MTDEAIAAAHRRTVEQVMSDERLLGALPADDSRRLLDWTVARLEAARDSAGSVAAYEEAADEIRAEARSIADAAAADPDPSTALRLRLLDEGLAATGAAGAALPAPTSPPPAPTGRRAEDRPKRGGGATRRMLLVAGAALLLVVAAVVMFLVLRGRGGTEVGEQQVEIPIPSADAWYEVLFTTPQRTGMPPSGSAGRLDERLVQLIDGAQRTVDVAAYDFELINVAEALVRAKERGVAVRMVTDTDNKDTEALKPVRRAGIPIVEDGRRALMHHKFVVIDGATVMTGAWNMADRDTYRHNNNAVIFPSPELARDFTNEFDKMFVSRAFGPSKPKDVPYPVVEREGARIEVYFASEQQVEPVIRERIRAATSSVAFMAFSFTLDGLGVALADRILNGVQVWGVVEKTGSETQYSEYGRLKNLQPLAAGPPFPGCEDGPPVVQDGNGYLMHHKVFVIDERTVIFGSFNFTANAAEDNDEALLVVDDPRMARQFLAEFCRVYNAGVAKK